MAETPSGKSRLKCIVFVFKQITNIMKYYLYTNALKNNP